MIELPEVCMLIIRSIKVKQLPAKDAMPTWKQDHTNLSLKANPT
jgi:hypothetical protein